MIDAPATVITPIEQAEAFVAATEGVQSRFLVEKLQGFGDDVKTDGSSIMRSALQCGCRRTFYLKHRPIQFRLCGTGSPGREFHVCPLRRLQGRRRMAQLKWAAIVRA